MLLYNNTIEANKITPSILLAFLAYFKKNQEKFPLANQRIVLCQKIHTSHLKLSPNKNKEAIPQGAINKEDIQ
jgi:hypothetical protein